MKIPNIMNGWTEQFEVGDKVEKLKGYSFPSTIVAIFQTTKGETRIVAEMDNYGLLHIFSPNQLKTKKPLEE